MIPFLPSQNPNVAAALAQAGGLSVRPGGTEAGGAFAPVFGTAIVGQLVSGLPATAFSGGEEGINTAAWTQLAEAVRVLTQNGPVSPATLEQMRGVMLVNIELLRRGAGEAQAMQATALPQVQPMAPVGVVGAPVPDALVPAPAVPGIPQVEEPQETAVRRREVGAGAESMMAAVAAGMAAPVQPAGRPDMNIEQAFAALERIVAQAPASELVPLARALRQVINTPVVTPALAGKVDVPAVRAGGRTVAVAAPRMTDTSTLSTETAPIQGPGIPAVAGPVPVRVPLAVESPLSVPETDAAPAQAIPAPVLGSSQGNNSIPSAVPDAGAPSGGAVNLPAAAPIEPAGQTAAQVVSPVVPAELTVVQASVSVAPAVNPVMPVAAPVAAAGVTAVPAMAPVTAAEVPVMPATAPVAAAEVPVMPAAAPVTAAEVPAMPAAAPVAAAGTPVIPAVARAQATEVPAMPATAAVEPVNTPVVPMPVAVESTPGPVLPDVSESMNAGPMFIPADDASPVVYPAFAVARPDAVADLEPVAVPAAEIAPVIAEPVDEPVSWLVRQAQTGQAGPETGTVPMAASAAPGTEPVTAVILPAATVDTANANVVESSPAIIPAVMAEPRPSEAGTTAPAVVPSSRPVNDEAAIPAIAITTLEVEPQPQSGATRVQAAPALVAEIPVRVAVENGYTEASAQVVGQPVQVRPETANVAVRPAANNAVEPSPVPGQAQVTVAPIVATATSQFVPAPVATVPVSVPAAPVSVQGGGEQTPEPAGPAVATASNTADPAGPGGTSRQPAEKAAVPAVQGEPRDSAKPPVAAREGQANPATERGEVSNRTARPARIESGEVTLANAGAAIAAAQGQTRETVSLPVAVQAVMARVADAISTARPGEVRELDLRLSSAEFGMVRVKFQVGEEGMVRVVIKTSTEQAAQAIREGLPQFRDTVESRHIAVQVAQVSVGTAADFGGGNNPHARPEQPASFHTPAQEVRREDPEFASRAREGYPRRTTLVDILA